VARDPSDKRFRYKVVEKEVWLDILWINFKYRIVEKKGVARYPSDKRFRYR